LSISCYWFKVYSMLILCSSYESALHPVGPEFESVHVRIVIYHFILMKKKCEILIGCNFAQKCCITVRSSDFAKRISCVHPLRNFAWHFC